MDDIDDEFKRLGYKGEMALKDQGIDSILGNYRKVLLESDQFVEMLELRGDKDETGIVIMEKSEKLNEKRDIYRKKVAKQEQLRQDIQKFHQKSKGNNELLKKLYERIHSVEALIQLGEGIENSFFCKQDFLFLKNEYERKCAIKKELLDWIDQCQQYIFSEGNEIELDEEIQNKESVINEFEGELKDLV